MSENFKFLYILLNGPRYEIVIMSRRQIRLII